MEAAEETPSGGGDDEKVKYPVGFRFKPTLQELVEFYLLPKLLDNPTVPNDAVIEADAYECDPEILTKRYEARGADENWYFLSPRSRRYPGGDRPTRRTADNRGRWKPSTGQSKPGKDAAAGHSKAKKVLKKNLSVGAYEFTENTLAYYVGDPRNETKTKWLMHELTVPDPEKEKDLDSPTAEKPRDHMLLNKYVMCRIYKSPLKKWKELENEEGGTSSASACDEEVPTSSQSGPAPEGSGEASALTPLSSKCAGKRPAAEQPTSEQANAPNKRASQHTMRAPPVGVGAAGYYDYRRVPAQLPPLMQWPPAIYSSMQGPVKMQRRPPLMNAHNGQPPVQGPPVLRLYPPHRAAATVPNSLGRTVMMRPPNLAAGPPVRPPSFPRPPPPQQQQMEDMMMPEMKLQKAPQERAPCAGQQQIMPAASTQPACFDEGANHPAGTKVMVPCTQFPAPHNFYPCSGVQQQLQQSSPAIPAASVPPGDPAPAADDAPGNKLPMQGDANEGSGNGDCSDYRKQPFADFAAGLAAAKNF
ncbi:hypothetical protein SETIT_7G195000v2 [Setaria italica]|uniref:NAC domain-containing protein n=1 Tax=Setaria italica TaxID=4555 RepID=A0A368RXS0_SETIT|nr:hypothetical protein SETIT_7G195000v2 [Setaria italica]